MRDSQSLRPGQLPSQNEAFHVWLNRQPSGAGQLGSKGAIVK